MKSQKQGLISTVVALYQEVVRGTVDCFDHNQPAEPVHSVGGGSRT